MQTLTITFSETIENQRRFTLTQYDVEKNNVFQCWNLVSSKSTQISQYGQENPKQSYQMSRTRLDSFAYKDSKF